MMDVTKKQTMAMTKYSKMVEMMLDELGEEPAVSR